MKKINFFKFAGCIAGAQAIGIIGSFFTIANIPVWYSQLTKPWFAPPNWIFGPVWTILYTTLGISLYLVLESKFKKSVKIKAVFIYTLQMLLNLIWSPIFFGLRFPEIALFVIIFMWLATVLNIYLFYKINKNSGILLFPYLLWISFASVLNLFISILN